MLSEDELEDAWKAAFRAGYRHRRPIVDFCVFWMKNGPYVVRRQDALKQGLVPPGALDRLRGPMAGSARDLKVFVYDERRDLLHVFNLDPMGGTPARAARFRPLSSNATPV